jgi:hypothetical protein
MAIVAQSSGNKRLAKFLFHRCFHTLSSKTMCLAIVSDRIIASSVSRLDTIIAKAGQSSSIFLANVTVNLLGTFQSCKASFWYDPSQNPRRVLTYPIDPVYNSEFDNEKWDYIIYVNGIIGEEEGHRFSIEFVGTWDIWTGNKMSEC